MSREAAEYQAGTGRKLKRKIVIIKRGFSCLEVFTIQLRESNVNKCGHLEISTCSVGACAARSRLNTPRALLKSGVGRR